MTSDRINTGAKVFLKSLSTAEEGREWRLIRSVVAYTGWLILFFVCGVCLISPEVRVRGPWILGWLSFCLAYLVALEVISRTRVEFYETSRFRMLRIQLVALLGSTLLWITGGAESYFWFIYLWSLIASALYFPWGVTWAIFCEVAVLYFLASLAAAGDIALINLASLLTSLAFLFVFTVVFRYLVENVRKYQVAERKLKYSEILQQIQQDIDTAISLQEVLDRILQRAADLVGARDGSLMLIEEDGKLHFHARVGGLFPEDKAKRTFMPGAPDEGIAGWVVRNCTPYVCQDTKTDTQFVEIIAGGVPIRSLVSVPIISHGVVLGVINVDSPEPNRFSEVDAELLVTLANQIAVTIERAELWDGLRQIGEKTLSGAEDLYDYIVDTVHRLTRCPVAMWRVDERVRTQATIRAHRGLREEYARERVLDLGHSVTGEAIRDAELVEVLDIQEDSRVSPKSQDEARGQGWESMLVVPLLAGPAHAVGTLSIYSLIKKRFARWDKNLLRTFANQAGVAIQNAERLQTIQQLNEVGQSLAALQESPEVLRETLQRIANTAIEVLGADVVDLYQYQADRGDFALLPIMVGERRFPDLVPKQIFPDDVIVKIAYTGGKIYASDAQKHLLLAGDWEFPREELPQERFVVREGIISSAAVPMRVGEEVLGVMFAGYRQRRDFDTDVELREKIEVLANQGAIAISNARLFEKERRRAKELEVVNEIGRAVSARGIEEIAELIYEQTSQLMDTTNFFICLYNQDRQELSFELWMYKEQPLEKFSNKLSGLTALVVREKKPLLIEDWDEEEQRFPVKADIVTGRQRSWLGVPLLVGEEVIGVISVQSTEPYAFNTDTQRLLETIASQAAIAIRNVRLYADLERQIERLKTLAQAGGDLGAQLDKEAIFETVVKSVVQTLDCTHCTVFVLEDNQLVPRASRTEGEDIEITRRFALGEGFAGWVARERESILAQDAKRDTRFSEGRTRPNVARSMVVVPVRVDGQVVGVISADQDRVNAFDERDLQMVETLALQAGTALEKARSYEHSRQQLDALRRIVGAIGAETDPLPIILEEAVKLFDAEHGSFSVADSAAEQLIYQARWEEGKIQVGEDIPEDRRVRNWHEGGITVHVARTGEAYRTGNAADDSLYKQTRDSTVSELAVPLKDIDGRIIGVLNLEGPVPDAFSQPEEDLCQDLANVAATAIEKDRVFDTEQRLNTQLEILHQVVQERSVKEVLDRTLEGINAILGKGASSSIARYDEQTDSFYEYRATGPLKDYLLKVPPRPIVGTGRHIVDTREPLYLDDVHNPPLGSPTIRKESMEKGVRSFAALPLKWQEKMVGALFVNVQRSISFTDELQRILQLFARQATIAIENAELFEQREQANRQLDRRVEELEVLTEIGRTVSNLGIDEILDLVYEQAGKIIDLSDAQVQIAFHDEAKNEVTFPLAVEQDNGEVIDQVRWSKREVQFREEDEDEAVKQFEPRPRGTRFGLTEYVMDIKKPVLLVDEFREHSTPSEDAKDDSFILHLPAGRDDIQQGATKEVQVWRKFGRLKRPTNSWLGVPMIVQDRVIGIISAQSLGEESPVDENQLAVLEVVANQAAVAIENARLYADLRTKVEQLERAQVRIRHMERTRTMANLAADFVHRINNMTGTIPIRVKQALEVLNHEHPNAQEALAPYFKGIMEDTRELLTESQRLRQSIQEPPEPELVDTGELLGLIARQVRLQTPAIIEINDENVSTELPSVRAVSSELEDAFRDVVTNAVEALSPQGGVLKISSVGFVDEAGRSCVKIDIEDNGPGIPEESLSRIFGLFFTTKQTGFGYGLWRTKNTVEALGGSITVDSQVGQGTSVHIKLPGVQ